VNPLLSVESPSNQRTVSFRKSASVLSSLDFSLSKPVFRARMRTVNMRDLIQQLQSGNPLSPAQVGAAANSLLDETVEPTEKAALLRALAAKGESPDEIAAFAECFLQRAVDPGLTPETVQGPLLDVCGTGGDKLDLFNVSTASVFVLAAGGASVVKHGNRGITSKSGGADVLEALGVRIDLPPDRLAECVKSHGAGFLFAPHYHPAFKAVVPVRKMLAAEGIRTIFNLIGPLLNPARPDYQLIGVFDSTLPEAFASILGKLGRKRAWAVHGTTNEGQGMDEISTLGLTHVWATDMGNISERVIDPALLGLAPATLGDLQGGDAIFNAAILRAILDGSERGPKRDIVTLNAAAGFVIAGLAPTLEAGLARAAEALDSGRAATKLLALRDFS
jgi:anthranilate phosphoribosyltransferase